MLSGDGMNKAFSVSVEHEAVGAGGAFVEGVTENGVAGVGEVDADLVLATSTELDEQQRIATLLLERAHFCQ